MLVGGSMVFSLPWAFPICGQTMQFESKGFWGMVGAIACGLIVGLIMFLIGRREHAPLLRKEALATVGLGWILAGILGGLPYVFSGTLRTPTEPMHLADAFFESVSGFTTTGASVLTHLEAPTAENPDVQKLIPRCVLFWRSFTHWLGGMGIIVLFVAILGQLGAAGKALMRREVPGPINETVRPRVRETAMLMWLIYVGFSVLLTTILLIEGMSLYDSLAHTFGTMATGGFSTFNASVGHFDSIVIEVTIVLFMIAAGTNFSLYYLVLRHTPAGRGESKWRLSRLAPIYRDPEFRCYFGILIVTSLLLTADLVWTQVYPTVAVAFRHAGFMAVSIMTTTGFGTEDFNQWSDFSRGLLLLMMFVGGCSGSTGGGIKVIRFMLFFQAIRLEIEQAYRPHVVRPLKVFGVKVDNSLRHGVVVYFSIVLFLFASSWMTLAAIEPDTQWAAVEADGDSSKLIDCASAVASSLNNIGPGLGVLGPHSNYAEFSPQGKFLLTMLMLLGRLELFAILVLFVPTFWRSH